MATYRRAVWVPEINKKYYLFLSCNENHYVLRDYIGKDSRYPKYKEHKNYSYNLPKLIKKTRKLSKKIQLEERVAWRKYLMDLSKELEANKNHEDIDPDLIKLIARGERYDILLKTICGDIRDGKIIYEKIIVDYPEFRFPPIGKNICVKGNIALYQENEDQTKKVKESDICGIVKGQVRIIIEEEFTRRKYNEYLDKVLNCKFMKAEGVRRELKNVLLFIVEKGAKTKQIPSRTETFSHIIICNNDNFPDEYEKIRRYI